MKEKIVLTSAACVFKKDGDDLYWFLVKIDDETGWEIPKTMVRPGESSVRASLRNMSEQGGMRVKAMEEVGRSGGATKVNNKIMSQRTLYYLMVYKDGEEPLTFEEADWFEHSQALRKVESKRDNQMLKDAKKMLTALEKEREKPIQTGK